ncbi:hypothetical protein RchiOBHm_Chr5g0022421 [Rosa chinensis]|uniref:Uncharacterized protein n=1 Tax=Rosa chinensis TaxID=74649 RepID=A0A2P6Q7T0_ROSCH|nr:hypothetical protein RchiOBHm_Chr5g0022421 [Rosa chinensis]
MTSSLERAKHRRNMSFLLSAPRNNRSVILGDSQDHIPVICLKLLLLQCWFSVNSFS